MDWAAKGVEEPVHISCCTIAVVCVYGAAVVCVYGAREGTRGGGHMPAPVRRNRSLIARVVLYGLFATSVKPAGCFMIPIARRWQYAA
jgi:hypothetical protein